MAFEFTDANFQETAIDKGGVVLIDFWAAWCKPCRAENPNVVRMYKKYGGDQFEILGVSLDRKKDPICK